MDTILTDLAEFASGLSYRDLPEIAVRACKDHMTDSLACALGALDCEPARMGRLLAGPPASGGLAGLMLGSREIVAPDAATFVNTCLIRYLDFNDTFPRGHPSDSLGGLFAVAPRCGASGRDLITAAVVAYEIFCRLSLTARLETRGYDQGFYVALGTTAGLANMLKLDTATTQHALALAAVANLPMRATRSGQLSMWKGAATANAARNAVFGVQLAKEGMTGPEAPFTGRDGFFDLIGETLELAPFGTNPEDFFIPRVNIKYWPVAYQMQAVVWAAIELRRLVKIEDLVRIEVETNKFAVRESGGEPEKWDPQTQGTADHSMPYILAWVLRHGQIDHTAFVPESYLDPSIRPLMKSIAVKSTEEMEKDYPLTVRLRIRAWDRAGKHYQADSVNPLGHPDNPVSSKDIAEKFRRLGVPRIGEWAAASALACWQDIENVDDLSAAFDSLVAAA